MREIGLRTHSVHRNPTALPQVFDPRPGVDKPLKEKSISVLHTAGHALYYYYYL